MKPLAGLCGTLAVAMTFAACQESSTAPVRRGTASPMPSLLSTSNSTTQFHFVTNGDNGLVSWNSVDDPSGFFTFGRLTVSRSGPTDNPQTFLFYVVLQCDALIHCSELRDGFGLIPNKDLSGGLSSNVLHLSTNTSDNPNFFVGAGPAGVVSVDWQADGVFQQRFSGTNEVSYPRFGVSVTERSQGSSTNASATASGTIAGLPMGPANLASIGTNHNVIIDIFR